MENTLAEVSFGEWLKRQRRAAGLTQEQLALQISCSTSALKKIEAEVRHPSVQIVEQLAQIFNIPQNEQTAFLRFARGDWQAVPSESAKDAPWRASPTTFRTNLPASLTSLIGREREIAVVRKYLSNADTRLVTLIGPPGIGKTRLGLEVARGVIGNFADGVFFVPLATLNDPNLVGPTVVQTLSFVEIHNRLPLEGLKEGIGDKQMMVVLDNCEHLIEDIALITLELLSACSRLKIIATSRAALRVPGEWLYPVPTLDVPKEGAPIDPQRASEFPALILFAERARAVRSDFALNSDNLQTVATICSKLDGLPLAIELIAAHIRWVSPQSLLSHLSGQFVLSTGGMRAVSARQKTLNNAISWSYDLLSEEEQKMFARLSVFVGGFTLEAAEAVAAGEDISRSQVTDLFGQLINKSLVKVETRSGNADAQARYGMLETIREYALEKLDGAREASAVRDRHAEFFAQMTEEADSNVMMNQSHVWLNKIDAELNNIRGAIHWSINTDNALVVFRLLGSLNFFIHSHAVRSELSELYDKALALKSGMARTAMRAKALNGLGFLFWADEYSAQQQQSRLEEALAIGRELRDQSIIATSLRHLGFFEMTRQNYEEARKLLTQSLDIYRELGTTTRSNQAWILSLLGDLAIFQHDLDRAVTIFDEDITILREIENKDILGYCLRRLAQLVSWQGDHEEAITICEESIMLNQQIDDQFGILSSMAALAGFVLALGRAENAARLFGAIHIYFREMKFRLLPLDQQEYDRNVAQLRALPNQRSIERARAKGEAMTLGQAITFALER